MFYLKKIVFSCFCLISDPNNIEELVEIPFEMESRKKRQIINHPVTHKGHKAALPPQKEGELYIYSILYTDLSSPLGVGGKNKLTGRKRSGNKDRKSDNPL